MSRKHAKPGGGIAAALAPYSKAISGALFGAVAMWLKVRGHGITDDELWQILGAAATGGGLIWAVPNRDPKAEHQRESVQPPKRRRGQAGKDVVRRVRQRDIHTPRQP